MTMTTPKIVSIDIETIPDESKKETFGMFNTPPKDESESGLDEWLIKQMSLNPEYCRVVGLNWMFHGAGSEPESVWIGEIINGLHITEGALLRRAWQLLCTPTVVVYNGLSFDIPVIMTRSAELGLFNGQPPPANLSNLKPWENRVVDLMKKLFQNRKAKSLKEVRASSSWILSRMSDEFLDIDAMTGGSVFGLYQAGDFKTLKSYGRLDAWTNMAIYEWGKGYWW
jgi:hypothetical protein